MRFSKRLRASPHCLPSPDGQYIATLLQSAIHVRSARSLSLVNHIDLPKDATGPVHRFQWSPSSAHLLVAIGERVDVFSVLDGSTHAAISHVSTPGTRPTAVGFAASDKEIFVCSSLGLKFSLHDISTSKTVELGNPKFSTPATARNGFSFRPRTNHLAFLTRVSGKDMISLHDVGERQILRSWFPDTVDAQRLEWSPDGTWLVLADSAAHGHKIIFHTADGHLFKTWTGQTASGAENEDFALSNGVKGVQFSADAKILAVADSSRRITVLDMKAVTSKLQLMHPTKIEPGETLQVWQEAGLSVPSFVKATQTIFPPTEQQKDNAELNTGCSLLAFDSSSTLLSTRLDESSSVVWVWDVLAAELRAVLLFQSSVTSVSWHPSLREVLLIRCEGDLPGHNYFVWDPLSRGPQAINLPLELPDQEGRHRSSRISWLNLGGERDAVLLCSTNQDFVLISLQEDAEDRPLPWQQEDNEEADSLLASDPSQRLRSMPPSLSYDDRLDDDDGSQPDDTFHWKRAQNWAR